MAHLAPVRTFCLGPSLSPSLPPRFLAPVLARRPSSTSPRTEPRPRAREPTPDEDGFVARAPHAPWHPPEYVDRKRTFTPAPLDRPLGVEAAPRPGENDGVDRRPWRERRDEFKDQDRRLAERQRLTTQMAKPYYYDLNRIHKGKGFVAPAQLLRADRARHFPNLRGATLAEPRAERDTTAALRGRVSLVSVCSGAWAERQAAGFADDDPTLVRTLAAAGDGVLQRVRLNVEPNVLRAWVVKLFMRTTLPRAVPAAEHARYFLVRRELSEAVKAALGIMNPLAGAVYLVDGHCRIRWAGVGDAQEGELESLRRGVVRLVGELRKAQEAGTDVGAGWPERERVVQVHEAVKVAAERKPAVQEAQP